MVGIRTVDFVSYTTILFLLWQWHILYIHNSYTLSVLKQVLQKFCSSLDVVYMS